MRTIVLPLVCFALGCSNASAQTDWRAVMSLQPGVRVRVAPQRVEGTLQDADDTLLVIVLHGRAVDIARSDIQRIDTGHNLAKKKTLVGFLIGWAVGTLAWRNAKALAPVAGLGFAGLGALIGLSDGAFDYRYQTVYEAAVP